MGRLAFGIMTLLMPLFAFFDASNTLEYSPCCHADFEYSFCSIFHSIDQHTVLTRIMIFERC